MHNIPFLSMSVYIYCISVYKITQEIVVEFASIFYGFKPNRLDFEYNIRSHIGKARLPG